MVATVVRYTGPFVRYSCTSSRSVASPPAIAGYTTRRTFSSGAASEASAIENRMFSLSVTFLKALISSAVTFFSARALIRCTVAINSSTSVSAISRERLGRVRNALAGATGTPPQPVRRCGAEGAGRLAGPRCWRRCCTSGSHLSRHADRPHREQLIDLGEHALQAHVARIGLDQRQHRGTSTDPGPALVVLAVAAGDDQRYQPSRHLWRQPAGHPREQRLLALVQRRGQEPLDPGPARRLRSALPSSGPTALRGPDPGAARPARRARPATRSASPHPRRSIPGNPATHGSPTGVP